MKVQKAREIVIEFERVQLIRKRARTNLFFCQKCRNDADFVFLHEATALFNTGPEQLFHFIKTSGSHYQTETRGEILVCLNSLLAIMKAKTNGSNIKMIEGENE